MTEKGDFRLFTRLSTLFHSRPGIEPAGRQSQPFRSNKFLNRMQVVPLTSKTDRLYPSEAFLLFKGKQRKAMADQLATVNKSRLFKHAGILNLEAMRKVEQALKVQLDIPESAQLLNGGLWSAPIHKEAELTRSYPRPILSTRHRQISTPR